MSIPLSRSLGYYFQIFLIKSVDIRLLHKQRHKFILQGGAIYSEITFKEIHKYKTTAGRAGDYWHDQNSPRN